MVLVRRGRGKGVVRAKAWSEEKGVVGAKASSGTGVVGGEKRRGRGKIMDFLRIWDKVKIILRHWSLKICQA